MRGSRSRGPRLNGPRVVSRPFSACTIKPTPCYKHPLGCFHIRGRPFMSGGSEFRFTCTSVYVNIYTYVYIHIYIYIHTYIYVYIHMTYVYPQIVPMYLPGPHHHPQTTLAYHYFGWFKFSLPNPKTSL